MSEESRAAKERVLAVYPNAKAAKFNLGMDSVSCKIVSLHGEASGFFMEDVEAKAWIDAAAKLPPAAPEPGATPVNKWGVTLDVGRAYGWLVANHPREASRRIAELLHDYSLTVAPPALRDDKESSNA